MLDSHRRRRPMRVLAYALLAIGAGVLLLDPTRSLQGQALEIRWLWSGILLTGTLCAIAGSIRDVYLLEFVGLPLLIAAMMAFVVLLAAGWTTGSIAFACFLGALVVIMSSRWLDLWRLTGILTRAERRPGRGR